MNVRTLATVVQRILQVHRSGAQNALQQIVAALRTVDGGAKADKQREIREALKQLEKAVAPLDVSTMSETELAALKILDPTGKTTSRGVQEVRAIISNMAGSPGKSADAIEQFRGEFQNVVTVCNRLHGGLKPFADISHSAFLCPEGYKEMTVWMKGGAAPKTLKELEQQVSDWLLLLRGYARLTSTDPAVPLIRVDDGSVGTVIAVVASVWGALMTTVQVVQSIAKDRREREQSMQRALGPSVDEELRAKVHEAIDRSLQAILDEHIKKLLATHSRETEDNEIRVAIQASTQKLYSFYLQGGHVSFSLESAESEGEVAAIKSLDSERRHLQDGSPTASKMLARSSTNDASGDQSTNKNGSESADSAELD